MCGLTINESKGSLNPSGELPANRNKCPLLNSHLELIHLVLPKFSGKTYPTSSFKQSLVSQLLCVSLKDPLDYISLGLHLEEVQPLSLCSR